MMIKWAELEDLHVIKKLESILGEWFACDVFFLDFQGHVRNYHPADEKKFFFPVINALVKSEKGKLEFFETLSKISEKIFDSQRQTIDTPGFFKIDQLYASGLWLQKEYLGCVIVSGFVREKISKANLDAALEKASHLSLPKPDLSSAFENLKPLNSQQEKYLQQLCELLAMEIITYHTELTLREERIQQLHAALGGQYSYHSMIGKSKEMQEVFQLLEKIKTSDSTVLIQGENGTGKELIAKAIHFNSNRKEKQFLTINCSAFNENLLDSELFGHVKGAFTGAIRDKKGVFEAADQGTLFLDEIGDMSPTMQVKLLRVLQQGTLTPVGSTEIKKVNVRVLAATNRNLKSMIEDGSFREDLYYRINVMYVHVPPLRERKEDIPLLIEYFLTRGCKSKNIPLKTLNKKALELLLDYPWPGNIRELENEIERLLIITGDEKQISFEALSKPIKEHQASSHRLSPFMGDTKNLKDAIESLEHFMIKEGLRRTNWNKSKLAKELGISRANLIMKVEKFKLDKRKILKI